MATNGIKEIKISNTNYLIEPTLYTTINQTAASNTFTADLTNFELFDGVAVAVQFTYTNLDNATLNINSTGAKSIYYNGAAVTANLIRANHTYIVIYDGTVWQLIGDNNVTQGVTTTSSWRKILLSGGEVYTANATATVRTDLVQQATNIAVQPSTGTVAATIFSGDLTGNADTASQISAQLAATTKTYLLGTSTSLTSNAANVSLTGDNSVYLTTAEGALSAANYSWNSNGVEKAYTTYNTTYDCIDFVFV